MITDFFFKVTQSCLTLCDPMVTYSRLFQSPIPDYTVCNSLGQNTGVGSLSFLQGIFPTQGSNSGLPHCRRILYLLSHQSSPKKAEHQRIDVFKLWCWRSFLRVPWTARRSNQSIPKEINPELEGSMLKLKLQFFGHLIQRADSLEKTLMLGKIESRRKRGQRRMRCLDSITDLMDMSLSKLWVTVLP